MTSDLLEENADLRKQVEELKEQLEKHKWNNIFLEDCAVYDKEIAEEYKTLQERIAELQCKLLDVHDCFISASSGDDFEMAEAAREVMEVLDIHCYRHSEVKSKLTEAKEIIKKFLEANSELDMINAQREAEQFLKSEVEK